MCKIINKSEVYVAKFKEIGVGDFFIVYQDISPDKPIEQRLYMKVDQILPRFHVDQRHNNCVSITNGYFGYIDDEEYVTVVNPSISI